MFYVISFTTTIQLLLRRMVHHVFSVTLLLFDFHGINTPLSILTIFLSHYSPSGEGINSFLKRDKILSHLPGV